MSELRFDRRTWLQLAALAAAGAPLASAQEPTVGSAVRCMAPMTGTALPETWVEPTSTLVGVILDSTKALREIDLGETEPAPFYEAE